MSRFEGLQHHEIAEIMNLPVHVQSVKPQSPGARGLKLNKSKPAKRFFDIVALNKLKQK